MLHNFIKKCLLGISLLAEKDPQTTKEIWEKIDKVNNEKTQYILRYNH